MVFRLLTVFLLLPSYLWACVVTQSEDYSFAQLLEAETIVVGEVISDKLDQTLSYNQLGIQPKVWLKGAHMEEFEIAVQQCTWELHLGKEYLLLMKSGKLVGLLGYSKENLNRILKDMKDAH